MPVVVISLEDDRVGAGRRFSNGPGGRQHLRAVGADDVISVITGIVKAIDGVASGVREQLIELISFIADLQRSLRQGFRAASDSHDGSCQRNSKTKWAVKPAHGFDLA